MQLSNIELADLQGKCALCGVRQPVDNAGLRNSLGARPR